MKALLLAMLVVVVTAGSASARERNGQDRKPTLPITCETVRAYVGQVGLEAARSVARAYGMTAAQERRARRCLATGR